MPDTRRSPRFAIASAFDARPWSGMAVLQRGDGDAVALPVFGSTEGVYDDPLAFLNGHGSTEPFNANLAAFNISILITSTDRIRIVNNGAANCTLGASASNAWWGLPTVATVIPLGGGSLTGASDWRRGMVWNGAEASPPRLSFTVTGEIGVFRCPPEPAFLQDVIVGLRERGEVDDLDDVAVSTCLEALDNAENDPVDRSIRWGVTDDGHVYWSSTDPNAHLGITWLSTTFRDRLGFTGLETVYTDDPGGIGGGISSGYLCWSIADRPMPGLIVPTRPIASHTPIQTEVGNQLLLTDGSYSSSTIGSYLSHRLEWVLDGSDGAVDLHNHWLEMRSLYMRGGEPGALYWTWGDSRRALDPRRVTASQAGYGLLYTIDRRGYAGRLPVRLHPDSAGEEAVEWEGDLRLRSRQTTRLSVKEEG